jgi:hypothetical protein
MDTFKESIMKRPSEAELKKYKVLIKGDTVFMANARLWQSKWREKEREGYPKGYPIGKSPEGKQYGNFIEEPLGEKPYTEATFDKLEYNNFLTDDTKEFVKRKFIDYIKKDKNDSQNFIRTPLFIKEKFLTNLLSSQPLCFNLFCELKKDLKVATKIFKKLLPDLRTKEITNIEFEYSPGRGNKIYLGDNTAFDVFIEYKNEDNKECFLGIEAKYTEKPDKPEEGEGFHDEYKDFTIKSGMFKTWGHLKHSNLNQIWRDHLLSLSMIKKYNKSGEYEDGYFALLYPKENITWKNLINKYKKDCLNNTHNVLEIHLENLINKIKKHHEWADELLERYMGITAQDASHIA